MEPRSPTTSPQSITNTKENSPLSDATMPMMRPFTSPILMRAATSLTSAPSTNSLRLIPQSQLLPAAATSARTLSTTPARNAADHSSESHYDPPSGWLFGVKPGEKAEKEGWENIWIYGFFGSLAFGVVGYAFKPDTS